MRNIRKKRKINSRIQTKNISQIREWPGDAGHLINNAGWVGIIFPLPAGSLYRVFHTPLSSPDLLPFKKSEGWKKKYTHITRVKKTTGVGHMCHLNKATLTQTKRRAPPFHDPPYLFIGKRERPPHRNLPPPLPRPLPSRHYQKK